MLTNEMKDLLDSKNASVDKDKKTIINGFNSILKRLLTDARAKVQSGELKIRDTTDLKNMYDVFSKIDDIENTGTSSGSGAIPKLSTPEENLIESSVKVIQKVTKDDEGKETKTKHVDLHDLAKLTDENIADLITKGQKQQNNTNATDK